MYASQIGIGCPVQYKPLGGGTPLAAIIINIGKGDDKKPVYDLAVFPPNGGCTQMTRIAYSRPESEWKVGTIADLGRPA